VSIGPSPNGREGFRGLTRPLRVSLTAGRRCPMRHHVTLDFLGLVFSCSMLES
jgi:hypothetical protein